MSTPAAPIGLTELKAFIRKRVAFPFKLDPVPMYKQSGRFHGWFFEFGGRGGSGIAAVNQADGCEGVSVDLAIYQAS